MGMKLRKTDGLDPFCKVLQDVVHVSADGNHRARFEVFEDRLRATSEAEHRRQLSILVDDAFGR